MPPRTKRNAAKGKAAGNKPAQQTIVDTMKRTSLRRKEKAPRHESSESEDEEESELDEMMESEDDEDDTGGAEESKDGETPSKNSKNMDPSAVLTGSYVLSAGNPSELSRRLKKTWKALQETPNQQQDAGVPLEQLRLVCAELFHEKIIDNDEKSVRSLAACCFAELLRVYAPDMPFKANEELYDAFQLILEQLRCLAVEGNEESNSNASSTDLHNLYILESLANVKSCSLLIGMDFTIDENEEPLLIQLFRTFFSTIRKEHSVKIENLMLSVMVSCVEESDTIDQPLLDVILAPLVHGGSAVDNSLMGDKSGQGSIERGPYHMAQELIRRTNDHLQNHLSHFFNSILVEASTAFVHKTSDLKEHVYTLIYEVHKINSSLLLYVLPNVCMQLQVDEIATRSEAIALMGRLFASTHADYGHDYMKNFRDFLGRFRDVSKEIRLQMVQVCAIIWQRKAELAPLIEKEFIQRLSDPEWEVRRLAVNEVCDLAANAIDLVSEDCLRQVGERMKDKKVFIRKETMTGLSQVYAAHISSRWDVQGSNSQGADKAFDLSVTSNVPTANTKKLGWVPDFVLKCFAYPQEELKLRVIQLLDDILLPKAFAEPTRAKGLAFLLHSLDASSKEALRRILSERAKCNAIVGAFLKARRLSRMTSGRPTGNVDESMLRATGVLERGLAPLFSETSNLGKLLEQLVRWKDQSVFKQLEILCDYSASQQDARGARDRLIKSVGSKTALGDFLKNVCRKLNNLTVSQGTIGTYFGFFIANDMHHHRENRVIVDLLLMVSRITPQLFTEFIHEEFEAILVAPEEEPNEESEEEPRERDRKAILGLLGVLGQFSKHWSANQAEDGLDKPVSSSIPSEKLRKSLEKWCLGADSDDDPAGNSSAALALANFFGYSKETEVLVSKLSTKKVLQSPQSPNAQAILQSLGVFSKVCPQHFVGRPTILSSLWQLVFEDFIVQSSQSDESTAKSKRQKGGSSAAKASEIRCAAIRVASNLLIHCHSEADTLLLERGRKLVDQLFGILRSDGRKWSSNGAHAAKFRATASRCLLKIVRSRKIEATLSVSEWHMLGFVMQDSSEDVRRFFLKTLTNNLVKKNGPHPHKYLSYLALAATEGNPNLKKSARGLLVAAVERMRRVFEASSSRASAVGSSGEDDESKQNSNALMVPEYAIPYVIHLLAHHPDFPAPSSRSFSLYDPLWSDQVQYLSLFFDGLVSGSGARGDNISFLLQMLTKLSECHDVANPDGSSFYPLVECAVLLLKRRIKIQSNLKAFPGKIYLPKQLFVPGRKSSEKSKTARNLSDSDGVRATPAKGIRMSTSLSPIKPSGFGGSFLAMSTPPASSKKRKSSVGTPGDRTSPKSSGPLTPNDGKRDSISGEVADGVTPPRRQSLMRQARSQAKTFVDQSSDSEKEADDIVLGGSVAARRSKRKSPGAASVVSDKISQVTDEEGEKDIETSSEPSSKKRAAPSPDDDDSEMPTFRASRRRRQT